MTGSSSPASPEARRRWRVLSPLLLVALGGLLDALWLPPGLLGLHLPALVLVADAPLLLLLWPGPGRGWAGWTLLYGFTRFAVTLPWLLEVGATQYLGAVAFLGPVYLLLGLALRLGVRRGLPFVPLVGLAVVSEELLRTVWMGGMPWPQRSLAFVGSETLRASAALVGAYGLSFLAGATSALAAGLPGLVRAPAADRGWLLLRWLGAASVPAAWLLLLLSHGSGRAARMESAVARREVGLSAPLLVVQGNVAQSLKHALGPEAANLVFNRHTTITEVGLAAAAETRTRVSGVLWPETMVPWPFLSPALGRRFPAAWRNQEVIVSRLRLTIPNAAPGARAPVFFVGAIHHETSDPAEVHETLGDYPDYDSLIAIDPRLGPRSPDDPAPPPAEGEAPPAWLLGRHDKVVRVPGGEYTPLGELLPPLRAFRDALSEVPEIARGADEQRPFHLGEWSVSDPGGKVTTRPILAGTVICFEIAFPARCRAWRRAGAHALFNAANYGWFGPSGFRAQIRAVAALRAAELGQTVVMAGNTGPSVFFDPVGRAYGRFEPVSLDERGQLAPAPEGAALPADAPPGDDRTTFRTGYVLDHVVADPVPTLYAAWGDWPWFLLAALAALAALAPRGRRRGPAAPDAAT